MEAEPQETALLDLVSAASLSLMMPMEVLLGATAHTFKTLDLAPLLQLLAHLPTPFRSALLVTIILQ